MQFEGIEKSNLLIYDNNLEALRRMPSGSVDLIYLDPPFFSGRDYNVIWGDSGEVRSFQDRWAGGSEKTAIEVYIAWMEERVEEMHRVLKETGSFYLHCDWHASHYLKVMCDRLFGYNNFKTTVVWHYDQGARGKNNWGRKHDDILFYTKSDDYVFNWKKVAEPFKSKMTEWRYTKGGQAGKEMPPGKVPSDVWDFTFNAMSQERVGYPTQKPLELLERIIKASSNKGDIVLDPFCGGGTTCLAAEKLGRKFIGIDESIGAIRVTESRIEDLHGIIQDTTLDGEKGKYQAEDLFAESRPLDVLNLPFAFADLNEMNPFEYETFIVKEFGGEPNKKQVGDKGIDGVKDGVPIQVKQSEGVGRNVVDNFSAALRRAKKTEGTIIAFSFTRGAYNEAARLKNEGEYNIELVPANTIVKINRRPKVSIDEMTVSDDSKWVTVRAHAVDPEQDKITVWNWYVNGRLKGTDIVCQRKGKDKDPTRSEFKFRYDRPAKIRATATDDFGMTGRSEKKIGLDNAYRSPSVARVG